MPTECPRPRPAVQAMAPYVPGKPIEEVRRELGLADIIKLASNENPLGPAPAAVAAAQKALGRTNLYPEPTAPLLRAALAQRFAVPADWVLAGNGSDELMRLLAEAYLNPLERVVIPTPAFSVYRAVAQLMGAAVTAVPLAGPSMDLDAMAAAVMPAGLPSARLVFLASPNNPTGGVVRDRDLVRFLERVPAATLVVLDQAYAEYAEAAPAPGPLVERFANLIVLRTFSKIYGMAGFRLGYGIARPALLQPLLTIRDPFDVNSVAQAAGLGALATDAFLAESRQLNAEGMAELTEAFTALGLNPMPSQANFILVDLGRPAEPVHQALLRRGVIVRPTASFGLPDCLRITVGLPEQNRRLITALHAALTETT